MNIKDYSPKYIDIETPMNGVAYGTGTFKEILDGVYSGKMYPLTNAQGNVVGMNVESGKVGAEDTLEQRKFERRYSGIDVMHYFRVAMDLRYNRHAEIAEVDESNGVYVKLTNGETIEVVPGHRVRNTAPAEELPDEVVIRRSELNDLEDKDIKRYLKEKYDHYLAGGVSKQYDMDAEEKDADGNECVRVYNIKWGRKV